MNSHSVGANRPERPVRSEGAPDPGERTMTIDQSHEIKIIKARIKATWMSGDYPQIARFTEATAQEFIARLNSSLA